MLTGPTEVPPVIVDSADTSGVVLKTGEWLDGDGGGDWGDNGCLFAFEGNGESTLTWKPGLVRCGTYRVSVWFGGDPNSDHATNAPFIVHHYKGKKTIKLDQTSESGGWKELGVFFLKDSTAAVELSNDANGNVVADAVKFEFLK
jgi:hypothetical protein